MNIGNCKLCQRVGVELQDSHLIPKAAYRLIEKSQGGDAPIIVKAVTLQKNEQVHGHVFCSDCEERFSDCGERWTLDHCNRFADGFQLHDAVSRMIPQIDHQSVKLFDASQIADINVEKLTYFAMSVIWRASIHEWKSGKDQLKTVKLGLQYNQEFRRYLMGGTFPDKVTLRLAILIEPKLWSWIYVPYGGREEYTRIIFPFLGLLFVVWIGNSVPAEFRNPAFFPAPTNYIIMSPKADDLLVAGAMQRFKTSKLVGSMRHGRK